MFCIKFAFEEKIKNRPCISFCHDYLPLKESKFKIENVKSLQWEQQINIGLTGITGELYMFVHKHVVTCSFWIKWKSLNTTSFTTCTNEGFHLLDIKQTFIISFKTLVMLMFIVLHNYAIRIWEDKILVRCFRIA